MKLVPYVGFLIVEKIIPPEKTASGLIIANSDADHPDKLERGRVLRCSGSNWNAGVAVNVNLSLLEGRIIVYQAHAGYWYTGDDGSKCRILQYSDICAIEEE